eukprot:4522425-Lingulodinium_polyedra.AAC.1
MARLPFLPAPGWLAGRWGALGMGGEVVGRECVVGHTWVDVATGQVDHVVNAVLNGVWGSSSAERQGW